MNHGKKYTESAKLIDRTKVYDPQELWTSAARPPRPSLTRPSSCTSVWALTAAMLTSRSAALLSCPTAPARPSASSPSARATLPRLLRLPAHRKSATTT